MEYRQAGEPDPACLTGQGDITEVTAEVCRTNLGPSWADGRDGIEAPCLLPFTLNGESHTKTLFSVGDQAYMDGSVLQTGEFRLKSLNPYN